MTESRPEPSTATLAFASLNFFVRLVFCLAYAPALLVKLYDSVRLLDFFVYSFFISFALLVLGLLEIAAAAAAARVMPGRWHRAVHVGLTWLISVYFVASYVSFLEIGLHLDSPVVRAALSLKDLNFGIEFDTATVVQMALITAGLLALSGSLLKFSEWLLSSGRRWLVSPWLLRRISAYSVCGFAIFIFFDFEADNGTVPREILPLYSLFVRPQGAIARPPAVYAVNGTEAIELKKRPHIVMVLGECFRWDHATERHTPFLFELRGSGACLAPERGYAGGSLTHYGAFSAVYGLQPYNYEGVVHGRHRSAALSILKANGYRLVGLDASGMNSYSPMPVPRDQFDTYEVIIDRPAEQRDAYVARRAAEILREATEPTFIFAFFYSTHLMYSYPAGREPFGSGELRFAEISNENRRSAYYRRYQNAVNYIDSLLKEVWEGASSAKLPVVFAFSGDHGEEFWEYGSHGHGSVRFEDVRTRVPLTLCLPGHKVAQQPKLGALADVFPTIFDWAGADREAAGKFFDGVSLLGEPREYVPLIGALFLTAGNDLALATADRKFTMKLVGPKLTDMRLEKVLGPDDKPLPQTPAELEAFEKLRPKFSPELIRFFKQFD
ncbi:MAG TPA: sulfatase-like hydrolase/transferase [Bdellovibrionales bacterium]|nr:sulfatase-like hydrolase/transferase [Bdellovibrionales bacterium]